MLSEERIVKYYSKEDPRIALKVIEGHFATSHSHVSHYLDMTTMKTRQNEAERIAVAMTGYYNAMGRPIDTIVCIDGTEVIGAFLASELSKAGVLSMNAHKTIYVVTPEYDSNGLMIFRDNLKPEIDGRNILLLLASASTGKTVRSCLECIRYYGGTVQGISAIFSAVDNIEGYNIDSLFNSSDIPSYEAYSSHNCPMCKIERKIEAIVNGHGYSML